MDPDFEGIYHEDDVKHYILNSTKRQDLYKAIHMDKSPRNPVFQWSSRAVAHALAPESMVDWTPWVDMVAAPRNVSIMIYAGEYDSLDGPLTHRPWIKTLKSLASTNLWDQPRKIYYVYDSTTSSYEVGGYYRTDDSAKFTFLTIPKSGHFVPATQLLATKTFITDMGAGGKLLCHKEDDKECQTGAIMCSFMKGCSNHGSCSDVTGRCTCNPGFYG